MPISNNEDSIERAVCGALMLNDSLTANLEPEEFASHNYRMIFQRTQLLRSAGNRGELLLLVIEELRKSNLLDKMGGTAELGAAFVASCTDDVILLDQSQMDEYCRIIREKAENKDFVQFTHELVEKAEAGTDRVECEELMRQQLAKIDQSPAPAPKLPQLRFPKQAMIGALGSFAEVMAAGTEVPEEFYFTAGAAIFGNACAGRLSVDANVNSDPRLYVVLIGETYGVKKSTALGRTVQFFRALLSDSPDMIEGVGSAEGLARRLAKNSHGVLCYDEFHTFLSKTRVQGSVLLSMVTSLFEKTSWQNYTKEQSVDLKGIRLSLVACSTLDTYQAIWTDDAIAIGLPNRLFIVSANRQAKAAWPEHADPAKLSVVRADLADCLSHLPASLQITDDAKAMWTAWYEALPVSIHTSRLDTIGFRWMGILAQTKHKRKVDQEIITAVIRILDYELALRKLVDPIQADNAIAKMEESLRRVVGTHGRLPVGQLAKACNANRAGLWIFQQALKNLVDARQFRQLKAKRKGTYAYEFIDGSQ